MTLSELRKSYRLQVKNGNCTCILSGLPITNIKQLSLEHLTPICRGEWTETHQLENIFPAHKIINNIKDNLLFCEWMDFRKDILQKSLKKYHLEKADRKIVKAAIDNIPYYNINPCTLCIWKNICELER